MRGGKREGAGRKPGTPNKITTQLKEAILEAAHQAGGPGGMVGYLTKQATHNSAAKTDGISIEKQSLKINCKGRKARRRPSIPMSEGCAQS